MTAFFDAPDVELVLRFLKNRWLRDVADQLEASGELLAFEDLDLDNDMVELGRVTGSDLLTDLAIQILRAPGDVEGGRATAALGPELEGELARSFLRLVALNLAFRMRSDPLLAELLAFVAGAEAPRLDPAAAGALLARARSRRDALALIQASTLTGDDLAAAAEAAIAPPMKLEGARIHVQAGHDSIEAALTRLLKPAEIIPWTQAPTREGAKRFLLLRRRGGWTTLLAEGERPDPDLVPQLARSAGIRRVAYASFGDGPPQITVHEGARAALTTAILTDRIGAEPAPDDVAGALRALGVLDLDGAHPRGPVALTFLANVENARKKTTRTLAFA